MSKPQMEPQKVDRAQAMDIAAAKPVTADLPEGPTLNFAPDVKMKLTKAGLTFSEPTAFVSNMSYCEFTYNGQPYTSNKQGIQHLNVVHHLVPDIAEKILGMTCAKAIKIASHDIPKSESWAKLAAGKLWDLNDAKYTQNPPLLERLIETAPYKLIEATLDSQWGGGGGAPILEQMSMSRV